MTKLLSERPTETATGPAFGLLVFGFCTQVGLPALVAAVLAVVCAFLPLVISQVVDVVRSGS